MSKWTLRLFSIGGHALATGQKNLAAKAAIEMLEGATVIGNYLKSYDAEAHDGRGSAIFTPHVEEALKFDSAVDALECWRTQSKTRPLRDDGKPNRPLTAFNITPERIE